MTCRCSPAEGAANCPTHDFPEEITPWLDDGDVRLYQGDVRAVLAELPDASVDCVVTSPPYWQLRDYAGMGRWEGGNPDCAHRFGGQVSDSKAPGAITTGVRPGVDASRCKDCGAVRHDFQIGLEPTIEEYVAALVDVFAQVRRVLAPWGTCWLNVGDSYAGSWGNQGRKPERGTQRPINGPMLTPVHDDRYPAHGSNTGAIRDPGLKPKDLCMVPARVALALQADGWWLRSRIIWAKPNPMPESVTDRPTSSYEEILLLTRAATYYYDAEAVREPCDPESVASQIGRKPKRYGPMSTGTIPPGHPTAAHPDKHHNGLVSGPLRDFSGRNLRNVWTIATEPTPEAHFATFPLELVRRCLAAGCPERVCRECGKPSRRVVERTPMVVRPGPGRLAKQDANGDRARTAIGGTVEQEATTTTTGWTDCGHGAYRPGVVFDPFVGSGKTAQQARRMGLHAVGIDGSAEYLAIAAKRLQQLSLLGGGA